MENHHERFRREFEAETARTKKFYERLARVQQQQAQQQAWISGVDTVKARRRRNADEPLVSASVAAYLQEWFDR